MLVHGAALDSHVGPQRRHRLFEARRAVDDDSSGVRNPRRTRSRRAAHADRLAFPAHALDREQHLLAVGARASATSSRSRSPFCRAGRATAVEDQPHDRLFGERARRVPSRLLRLAPDAPTTSLPTGPATAASTRRARTRRVLALRDKPRRSRRRRPGCGALVGSWKPLRHSRVLPSSPGQIARGRGARRSASLPNVPVSVPLAMPVAHAGQPTAASSSPGLRRP